MANHEWDDNETPLAYLITFRTFGSWLHGDEKRSVDRHGKNVFLTPGIAPNINLSTIMSQNMYQSEFRLNGKQRSVVESAVRSVCKVRGYTLMAINVRTNHVHTVVSSLSKPDPIMGALKSNSTRELRDAGLVSAERTVWARGGSTRFLWKPNHVDAATDYVLNGQGDDLPKF